MSLGMGGCHENELTSVALNSKIVEQNAYDPLGNRIESIQGGSIMAYVFHEGNVWEEENLTSNVVTNRDYANGLQIEFIVTSTWSQYYLIEDALGSVRLVTGSTASSVFSSNYKPYGLNYGMIGSSEFMYTGKQNDLVTGFYFYGARFYYPAIGRFISEDTISGSITSPLSLNRYSYVEDNPESFNDPSGNMLAYPFGGQAYSIHPVAPVPAPTPPPAPSQPPTPPPSTPASPSKPFNGNSATTQSASQGPGYWNWLESQTSLKVQLLVTVAGDVASIFDPFAKGIFSTIARTLSTAGSLIADISSLASAFLEHDLSGAVARIGSFAWDLTNAVIAKANWWQRLGLAGGIAIVGAGDVVSGSGLSDALAAVGIFQLTTDMAMFFASTYTQWENTYPSG